MPGKSGPARTYFTLREAFDFVGTSIYGPNWRGFEADCEPARAAQPTDGETLLKVQGPDGRVIKRLPVPKRPIDDKHRARFGRAIGRHIKALKELLRLLHSGTVPTEFIPENATTAREDITASDWPDPEKFDPKKPTWGDLWFNIAADRVVRTFPKTSSIPGNAHGDGSLWWAYGGRAGHVEINREALESALRPPEKAKESRAAQQGKKAPKPRGGGRKKGSGSFADKDKPMLELMKPLIAGGKSHWAAAMEVAPQAAGVSNLDESKAKRLVKRFKEWEKTTQFN